MTGQSRKFSAYFHIGFSTEFIHPSFTFSLCILFVCCVLFVPKVKTHIADHYILMTTNPFLTIVLFMCCAVQYTVWSERAIERARAHSFAWPFHKTSSSRSAFTCLCIGEFEIRTLYVLTSKGANLHRSLCNQFNVFLFANVSSKRIKHISNDLSAMFPQLSSSYWNAYSNLRTIVCPSVQIFCCRYQIPSNLESYKQSSGMCVREKRGRIMCDSK